MPVPTLALTGPMNGATEALRPYLFGLMPLTTLLAPFTDLISYRSYQLRNTRGELTIVESGNITRIKRRFDVLYPGFAPFGGSPPVRLLEFVTPIRVLEFVTTLRDGFNASKASDAVAALLLPYYLEGSANNLCASQRSSGIRSEAGALAGTWPYLIHELIKRYLTDYVLQSAYKQVTNALQKSNGDENEFADRIAKAACECCNVFRDRELVNYFIHGLPPATIDAVTERVRHPTPQEQGDLTIARRIAVAERNTFRARIKATTTATPARARLRSNTLFMGEPEASPDPSPFRRDPNVPHLFAGPDQYWADLRARDPEQAHTTVYQLELLFYTGAGGVTTMTPMIPKNTEESFADPVLKRPYSPPPVMTEEQIEKTRLVIPTDYWGLSCWTCRGGGQTTFTGVHLTPSQRLYFAYCYYVYQCKANPHMAEWYKQFRAAQDRGDHSGVPPPSQPTERAGRGRGRGASSAGRGGSTQNRLNPNRRERESQKRTVSFGRGNGVHITTHVSNEPTQSAWADSVSDPDDEDDPNPRQGKGLGQ